MSSSELLRGEDGPGLHERVTSLRTRSLTRLIHHVRSPSASDVFARKLDTGPFGSIKLIKRMRDDVVLDVSWVA